jgi:hypothetical protein
MNRFLLSFLERVFIGVALPSTWMAWAVLILLVLAILLAVLFHRGVMEFQDYE